MRIQLPSADEFVFSVASTATGRLQIKPSGSGDENEHRQAMSSQKSRYKGRFPLTQNFRNFRFGGKWNTFRRFSEKVENLKRWSRFPGWNFRTECRVPFTFLVVCTSSRSTVGHRHVPGFTTKWNNFLPIGNSTFATKEISGFFS